ncbi:PGF-pre-PGF domain-containing protein [Haloplanus halophilus]|uniref:PGF-pre-PGF domain-containing protein n=1 Tax=Haloplanus halophilus TaxID=2949993 RepID=UPI002041E756|nr:PGF-pre-PGF domain-containing protein [Haloplanus sp. GDY1]
MIESPDRDSARGVLLALLAAAVVVGGVVGTAGVAAGTASGPNIDSPTDDDGDGTVEVRSAASTDEGASTVRVTVSIGTAGNNATFVFDADGDFSTTPDDQGVNGSTTAVTITDGGAGDLDGSEDGSITTDLVVDGGSANTFTEGSIVLGITEGTSITTSPDTTVTSLAVDNTDPTIDTVVTRDAGPAPGSVIAGSDGSASTADDGQIDQLVVTFSEDVDDSTVRTDDFDVTGYTIDAITDAGTPNNDTVVIDLEESGSVDTGATPTVQYTQGTLADEAGNLLDDTTESNPTDGVGPRLLGAQTGDADRDGTVDRINVTFSENVDDGSLDAGDFSSGTASIDAVSNPDGNDDAVANLTVSGLPADDTSVTPDLTLAQGNVTDTAGNPGPEGSDQTLTTADGAAPAVVAANTYDSSNDGSVDQFNVTLSEPLDDGASTFDSGTFSLGTGTADDAGTGDGGGDDAVVVTASGISGTGATPTVTLNAGQLYDSAGNALGSSQTFTGTTDGAAPRIDTAETGDATDDGTVDRINVTFSEAVNDTSLAAADFSVVGGSVGSVANPDGTNDAAANLTVSGLPAANTSVTPDLTLAQGNVTDLASTPNDGPGDGDQTLTPTDGVGPRIDTAVTGDANRDGTVDRINVTFTENVDDGTLARGDFSSSSASIDGLAHPGGPDDAAVNLTVSKLETENTSVTPDLTLTQGSVDDLASTPNAGPSSAQTVTSADGAPPLVVAARTSDANDDGDVDEIVVTHSEAIDDAASTLDTTTYAVGAGSVTGVDTGTSGDDDNATITVSGLTGTSAAPDVTLDASRVYDPAGNALASSQTFTGTTSGARPVVTAVTTLDRDGDGDVDAAEVTFSAAIDDSTLSPSAWTIGGRQPDSVVTGATPNDDAVELRIATDGDEVPGTGPAQVTYTPGTARDTNGNALAALTAGGVDETDAATPVVTNVSASATDGELLVTVEASEPLASITVDVSGPAPTTLSSFSTSGSGPYTHTLAYEPPAIGEFTVTLDTAADAAGNDGAGGETATATISGGGGGGAASFAGSPSNRAASSRAIVFSDSESTTLSLSGTTFSAVEIRPESATTGFVRASELRSLPDGTAPLPNRVGNPVSVQVPAEMAGRSATVRLSVRQSQVGVDAERLRIAHYDDATDTWETLDTQVAGRSGSIVTVQAETPGFSTFALTAAQPAGSNATTSTPAADGAEDATATATPRPDGSDDATAAPGGDDGDGGDATAAAADDATATESSGDGFGPLPALLAAVAAALLLGRRRSA